MQIICGTDAIDMASPPGPGIDISIYTLPESTLEAHPVVEIPHYQVMK